MDRLLGWENWRKLFLKKIFFYWNIVDLQCYVSFRCTA